MSGKTRGGRDLFDRCAKRHTVAHSRSAPLDDLEGRMALVQMPYRWFDTQHPQRAHNLLHAARRFTAAIKPMCNRSVRLLIVRKIAVEQEHGGMAGAAAPNA